MKYAFSTLACPDWHWNEICATAKDFGFDGIEVRGIGLQEPETEPFLGERVHKTVAQLAKLKLRVPCLSSDSMLNQRAQIEKHLDSAHAYIRIAESIAAAGDVPAPYVRVLADTAPEPREAVDVTAVARDLSWLAAYAEERGVPLVVETNGAFAKTDDMLNLLELVAHPNLGVLWDIHHTCRFANEPPSLTYNRLKTHIRHVHVKDSLTENGRVVYQMLGAGDIPVTEALKALREGSFDGFVSLEWVKRWCPELAEPGIVFPLFISYVKAVGA